jgi:2'-5' RNA ligase
MNRRGFLKSVFDMLFYMSQLRVFFAIDFPEETQAELEGLLSKLKSQHPHHSIRWSKPHHLHVTLQFLGELDSDDLAVLVQKVKNELSQCETFFLEFGKIELFPTPYHPRIISLSMGPNKKLAEVSQRIGQKILECGYEIETRPYRGHLTLARISQLISLDDFEISIKKIPVKEIILYRSEPSSHGSNYSVLERFGLK